MKGFKSIIIGMFGIILLASFLFYTEGSEHYKTMLWSALGMFGICICTYAENYFEKKANYFKEKRNNSCCYSEECEDDEKEEIPCEDDSRKNVLTEREKKLKDYLDKYTKEDVVTVFDNTGGVLKKETLLNKDVEDTSDKNKQFLSQFSLGDEVSFIRFKQKGNSLFVGKVLSGKILSIFDDFLTASSVNPTYFTRNDWYDFSIGEFKLSLTEKTDFTYNENYMHIDGVVPLVNTQDSKLLKIKNFVTEIQKPYVIQNTNIFFVGGEFQQDIYIPDCKFTGIYDNPLDFNTICIERYIRSNLERCEYVDSLENFSKSLKDVKLEKIDYKKNFLGNRMIAYFKLVE